MKWITRQNANVDRIACPWLIKRFIDQGAEFLYVPAEEVMRVAGETGAIPYDVPNVELGHVDGRCSFESIVLKYGLTGDKALMELAKIVHAADVSADIDTVPEGRGLKAIAYGFALSHGLDDPKQIELETKTPIPRKAWLTGTFALPDGNAYFGRISCWRCLDG